MRTMPLSARVEGRIVDFESIVQRAGRDGRITEAEALRIIAAGRAMARDSGSLAEAVDLIGTVARGTDGVYSRRVVEKVNRIKRRANVLFLRQSDAPEAA